MSMLKEDFRLEGESFYDILQVERTATDEEIKRSYQRLIRQLHPDKRSDNSQAAVEGNIRVESDFNERFLALQRAWAVLKDPQYRRKYDAALACRDHADLLLYETLVLSDLEYNNEDHLFKYACRCGGFYTVSEDDAVLSEIIVGCDECSFSILVKNPHVT